VYSPVEREKFIRFFGAIAKQAKNRRRSWICRVLSSHEETPRPPSAYLEPSMFSGSGRGYHPHVGRVEDIIPTSRDLS
jgi:hypothetical protein